MPVKTLHLTYLFHEHSGGVATFYRAMMRKAAETGREMVMVAPGERWDVEQISPGVRLYRVEAGHSLIGDRRYRVLLPHHFLFPGSTRFKRILEEERPDVVEACDKYSLYYLHGYLRLGWAGRGAVPTTIATSMERMDDNFLTYFGDTAAGRWFCRWYMREIYFRIPRFHLAISRYVAEELEAAPTAAKIDKVRVLPLGVDSNTFRPAPDAEEAGLALRAELGIPADRRVLVYAGRLSSEKNIPLLLECFQAVRKAGMGDVHLLLIGSGMLAAELDAMAHAAFGGAMHRMAHVEGRERLARLLRGADVFVHPNPREPFGIGPLEAMACGIPVVLPDRGGVREYAHDGNSWLAEPKASAYAAAIRCALQRGPERENRLRAARRTAELHDWDVVTERFFAQYEQFHRLAKALPDPWPVPVQRWAWPRRERRRIGCEGARRGAGRDGKAA